MELGASIPAVSTPCAKVGCLPLVLPLGGDYREGQQEVENPFSTSCWGAALLMAAASPVRPTLRRQIWKNAQQAEHRAASLTRENNGGPRRRPRLIIAKPG